MNGHNGRGSWGEVPSNGQMMNSCGSLPLPGAYWEKDMDLREGLCLAGRVNNMRGHVQGEGGVRGERVLPWPRHGRRASPGVIHTSSRLLRIEIKLK